ncbi:hypothetical protein GPECTOR_21g613 [Gonium pectorale]|uniref:Uncharacterized protein n=1 Tax=Gonium pectorale TaxID=33097 RepID=A0A150GHU7_GONPE|nr:hypothetical protein GPECTOR_21g613 [Gonium pectorale]|eukprot:KXZ49387.1 hypothetical protein GPECTOR_21g613 [Gonium pectorale]
MVLRTDMIAQDMALSATEKRVADMAEQTRAAMMDVALQQIASGHIKAAVGVLERHYSADKPAQEAVKFAMDCSETLGYLREVQALTEENRIRAARPGAANREFREQAGWWAPREQLPKTWFPTPTLITPAGPGTTKVAAKAPAAGGARPISPQNPPPSTPAPPQRGSSSRRMSLSGVGAGGGDADSGLLAGADKALRPSSASRRAPRASAPGGSFGAMGGTSQRSLGDSSGTSGGGSAGAGSVGASAAAGAVGRQTSGLRPRRGASGSGLEPALYDGQGDAAVPGTGPLGPMPVPPGVPRYTVNLFHLIQQQQAARRRNGEAGEEEEDEEVDPSLLRPVGQYGADPDGAEEEADAASSAEPSPSGLGPGGVMAAGDGFGLHLGTGFRALADEDAMGGFRSMAINAAAARVVASDAAAHSSNTGRAFGMVGSIGAAAPGGAAQQSPGGSPRHSVQQRKSHNQRGSGGSGGAGAGGSSRGGPGGYHHAAPPPLQEAIAPQDPTPPPAPPSPQPQLSEPQPSTAPSIEALSSRRSSVLVLGARRSLPMESLTRSSANGLLEGAARGDDTDGEPPSRSAVSANGAHNGLTPTPPPPLDGRPSVGSRLVRGNRGLLQSSADSPVRSALPPGLGSPQLQPPPTRTSVSSMSGRLRRDASTSGAVPVADVVAATAGGADCLLDDERSSNQSAGGSGSPAQPTRAMLAPGSGDSGSRPGSRPVSRPSSPAPALLSPVAVSQMKAPLQRLGSASRTPPSGPRPPPPSLQTTVSSEVDGEGGEAVAASHAASSPPFPLASSPSFLPDHASAAPEPPAGTPSPPGPLLSPRQHRRMSINSRASQALQYAHASIELPETLVLRAGRDPPTPQEGGDPVDSDVRKSDTSAQARAWVDSPPPTRHEPAPFAAEPALPPPQLQRQASPSRNARNRLGAAGSASFMVREESDTAPSGGPLPRPTSARYGGAAAPAAAAAPTPTPLFSRRAPPPPSPQSPPAQPVVPVTDALLSVLHSVKPSAGPLRPTSASRARRTSMPANSLTHHGETGPLGLRLHTLGGSEAVGGQHESRPWGGAVSPRKANNKPKPGSTSGSGSGSAPAGATAAPGSGPSSPALGMTVMASRQAQAGGPPAPPSALAMRAGRLSSTGGLEDAASSPVTSVSGEDVHMGVGAMPSIHKKALQVVKQTLDI